MAEFRFPCALCERNVVGCGFSLAAAIRRHQLSDASCIRTREQLWAFGGGLKPAGGHLGMLMYAGVPCVEVFSGSSTFGRVTGEERVSRTRWAPAWALAFANAASLVTLHKTKRREILQLLMVDAHTLGIFESLGFAALLRHVKAREQERAAAQALPSDLAQTST